MAYGYDRYKQDYEPTHVTTKYLVCNEKGNFHASCKRGWFWVTRIIPKNRDFLSPWSLLPNMYKTQRGAERVASQRGGTVVKAHFVDCNYPPLWIESVN